MKVALITGVLGQDGAYLAKFLLEKEYIVYGLVRKNKVLDFSRLDYLGIRDKITFCEVEMLNFEELYKTILDIKPAEIYNLASQSSVGKSFYEPYDTYKFNTNSVLNLLEVIRKSKLNIKFFQASTNEIYGFQEELPVNESTCLNPINMYGVSKTSAHNLVSCYRNNYGIFASSGILFNHESILRSSDFFIKKVVSDSVKIKLGKKETIKLGNLYVRRDFGFAPKYVEAMYLTLQHSIPDDFIISSGKSILLKDIVEHVFNRLNLDHNKLIIDKDLIRENDIKNIYGSNKKIKDELFWEYNLDFFDVLDEMIDFELKRQMNE